MLQRITVSIQDFIINIYCLIDDILKNSIKNQKLRQKGFGPTLYPMQRLLRWR